MPVNPTTGATGAAAIAKLLKDAPGGEARAHHPILRDQGGVHALGDLRHRGTGRLEMHAYALDNSNLETRISCISQSLKV